MPPGEECNGNGKRGLLTLLLGGAIHGFVSGCPKGLWAGI